jgi:hypothetical protein
MTGPEAIALGLGATVGAGTGALAALVLTRIRREFIPTDSIAAAADQEAEIRAASAAWARANDLPEAADLIAHRLRFGLALRNRARRRKGDRRW